MKIKYYLFCLRWIWSNKEWENGRQKWKMMDRDWKRCQIKERAKENK
jgi:hypothetical protein